MTHMTNKLMLGATIGALMVSGAFAQSPNVPAGSTASPPAATQPAPAGKSAAPAAGMTSAKGEFVASQKPDQWLASKFKGTDVLGSDNQKIGDVSDILFDKDGKVEAYVIGVGGFLGIGSKDVALAPSAFQIVPADASKHESDKLRLSMTKDELKNAANFEPYKAPSSTTGMGSSGSRPLSPATTTRPAPAGSGTPASPK